MMNNSYQNERFSIKNHQLNLKRIRGHLNTCLKMEKIEINESRESLLQSSKTEEITL